MAARVGQGDLARKLLRSPDQHNALALVVSTENITQNWYRGNDRTMLLSNCLFRCGAAAILLSNRRADRRRARFRLLHLVRTHLGKKDDCYRSVFQEEDEEGVRGVRLSKQIMQVHTHTHRFTYTHTNTRIHAYVYTYIHTDAHIHTRTHARAHHSHPHPQIGDSRINNFPNCRSRATR